VDEFFELEIRDFAFGGMAVGRAPSGKVCFVGGAAPGEKVRVKTAAEKKTHLFGALAEILEASPDRIEPLCPLAVRASSDGLGNTRFCACCAYQHVPYEKELAAKDAQLRDFVKRWLKLDPAKLVKPPQGAPSRYGWRNKISLSVRDGVPVYLAGDNVSALRVGDCPLAKEGIRALMRETLKDGAKTGAQTRLSFRESAKDGALLWPDDAPKDAPPLAESLPQGEFTVPRESFFQVNTETAGLLLKDFSDIVAKLKPELLLDLYCGVGVFGIAGAKAGAAHVEACEIDAKAVACACANAKAAGLDNCRFHAGDAAKLISKLGSKAVGNSLLVLDPPRSGLSEKALKGAVDAGAGHIVYASCAADSLCRDLKGLLAGGYAVESLRLFDMFPATAHFETLALLSRTKT
jgi:23S rRNA (uracil1939-C5)-methyltransferase